MDVGTMDAALAAKKAQDSELVQLKTQVDRLRGDLTPGKSKDKKLREACTNFEAVFIGKLWEQMRATVPKGGYLESQQSEMYRSMFDRDFSEKLAKDGGIGLGDMLYGQLKGKLNNSTKGIQADGAASVLPGKAVAPQAAAGESQAASAGLAAAKQLNPLPQRPQASAPVRPASVSGEVMPDVEALAKRIEDAYDRRAQNAGGANAYGAATGSRLAVIG
ncbi:MAG: rod-binding protein [Humidesulfovibrio sp.]|uniref:rod-binding protein n=1 Tax=Humidesulfovibrio sp. TaxID=2910988 RepID=UPI0027E78989|nr:rod-binding protein [Humidesulfovibrio sp.]MDQ7833869.1 rod-binding protein [Humidesulfovibrio sp.]